MKMRLSILAMSILAIATVNAAKLNLSIADKSSEFTTADRTALHVVDGSGLDANNPPDHTTNPNGFMWLNSGDGTFPGGTPASDPDRPSQLGHITFNLNGTFTIDSFRVWNYNEVNANTQQSFTNRGVQTLTISIAATSGGPFTPLVDPTSNTTTWTFAQAPGNNTYTGQLFSLSAPVSAAFVRFDIKTNYGDANGFVGLSEVQIFSVPEPGTWSLLGAAGMTMSILARRRK
jgi:hypothetical protein